MVCTRVRGVLCNETVSTDRYYCASVGITDAGCGYAIIVNGNVLSLRFKTAGFSRTQVDVGYCVGCGTSPLSVNNPHDCINGACLPQITYNTPGKFATLAACQSGCAKNSSCTGECVSASEIAALQQAAANLKARYCQ
jgi:hypothetical protein